MLRVWQIIDTYLPPLRIAIEAELQRAQNAGESGSADAEG